MPIYKGNIDFTTLEWLIFDNFKYELLHYSSNMAQLIAKLVLVVCIFLLGVFSSNIYAEMNHEKPLIINNPEPEEPSLRTPQNWIDEDQIKVYNSRIILDIQDAEWAAFTPTGSMEPVLNHNSHAIELVPDHEDDIVVGDICSYKSNFASGAIIHRVVYKGQDEEGTYFVFKGDNNPTSDPGRIRFDKIQRCVVAIIY